MRAMGAAIEKAVLLAFELQCRNYAVEILTGTTDVVDDVIPDDNVHSLLGLSLIISQDLELDSQTRRQSTIELRIRQQ